MIGPFCYKDIATDEEYIVHLKKQMKLYSLIILCGIITFLCILFNLHTLADYAKGFLAGMGSGLIVGGLLLFVKNTRILRNAQKLREERIKISDERNHMISDYASKTALIGVFIEIYFIFIVSILMNSDLYRLCAIIISSFILLYFIAFRIYSKKY